MPCFACAVVYLLMRVWPVGGGGGMGGARQDSLVVQLPFSEFVSRARADEVHSVAIDGPHINFALRSNSGLLAARPDAVDPAKVTFYTLRPADYSLPYEVLEKHKVTFTAVDKQNRAVTFLVSDPWLSVCACARVSMAGCAPWPCLRLFPVPASATLIVPLACGAPCRLTSCSWWCCWQR